MSGRVEGATAFVTGAARGIGRACALRLAEEGADLALLDIVQSIDTVPYPGSRSDDLAETAAAVESRGRRAVTFQADVRDGVGLRDIVGAIVSQFGQLDILVAAAGVDSGAPAWELTDEQWQTMIDVNLTGVWQSTKAVAPTMIDRGSGAMVLVSSVLAHKHNPGYAHYTAAKHGVLGLTRALALELAPHRVRVNSVDPTAVRTEMGLYARGDGTTAAREERLRRWNAMPELMVEPIDVANAVLFLASSEARYITGSFLPVDLGAMLT